MSHNDEIRCPCFGWAREYGVGLPGEVHHRNCKLWSREHKGAEVHATKTELIVLGEPDDNDESHNCDAMGCGTFSHVLFRFPLPSGVQGLRHQGIPPSPAADPQPDSVHSAQPEGQEVTAREAGLIATLRQARDALALVLAEPVGDGIRVSQRISAEMEHGAKHVIAAINEALQEPPCSS